MIVPLLRLAADFRMTWSHSRPVVFALRILSEPVEGSQSALILAHSICVLLLIGRWLNLLGPSGSRAAWVKQVNTANFLSARPPSADELADPF